MELLRQHLLTVLIFLLLVGRFIQYRQQRWKEPERGEMNENLHVYVRYLFCLANVRLMPGQFFIGRDCFCRPAADRMNFMAGLQQAWQQEFPDDAGSACDHDFMVGARISHLICQRGKQCRGFRRIGIGIGIAP